MGRDRYQTGHVEEIAGRVKRWKGHYYIYAKQSDGSEKRVHKSIIIGQVAKLTKSDAKKKLRTHITKVTRGDQQTATDTAKVLTVEWFWRERFLPMKEPTWKESSKKETIGNIRRYVIGTIGHLPLRDLNKFVLQQQANDLALKYSKSVVDKYLIWTRAILEEAVDQEFLGKNPARKLETPQTRAVSKRTLTPREISIIFQCMPRKERLVMRLSLVLGLRPGELLALRWNDIRGGALRVDENARYGKLYPPKTDASDDFVWLPAAIEVELQTFREECGNPDADLLIFPTPTGKTYWLDNFRSRVFRPALAAAEKKAREAKLLTEEEALKGITLQMCRRTCATLVQKYGNIKDIQCHLRHAQASTTLGVYVQEIPESVRKAVVDLDDSLFGSAEPKTKAVM
jgi:integrase